MPKYPTAYKKAAKGYGSPGLSEGFVGPPPLIVAPPPVLPPPAAMPVVPPIPPWALHVPPLAIGIGAGLWLGLEVRKDIQRFLDNAEMPFYDAAEWEHPAYWGSVNEWDFSAWTWVCDSFASSPTGEPPLGYVGANAASPTCFTYGGTFAGEFLVTPQEIPDSFNHALNGWLDPLGRFESQGPVYFRGAATTNLATEDAWDRPVDYPGYGTPLALPIMKPVTAPQPKPWHDAVAEPGTQPSEEETPPKGKKKKRGSVAWPIPFFPIGFPVIVMPGNLPWPFRPQPDTIVVEPPAPRPDEPVDDPSPSPPAPPVRPVPPPPGPTSARPPRGTKERKVNVRSVAGKAWAALNFGTEVLDFLDVLWKSIDPDVRQKQWTRNPDGTWNRLDWNDKLRDLYDHWDEIDIASALANYVNNQAEDFFFGQVGRIGNRGNQLTGQATGFGGAVRRVGGEWDTDSPLPTLEYDRDTGQFSLDWKMMGWSSGPLGPSERPGEIGGYTGYGD